MVDNTLLGPTFQHPLDRGLPVDLAELVRRELAGPRVRSLDLAVEHLVERVERLAAVVHDLDRDATVISLISLVKILPRLASIAPLNRLTFDHLLCPAMDGDCYATTD